MFDVEFGQLCLSGKIKYFFKNIDEDIVLIYFHSCHIILHHCKDLLGLIQVKNI